MVENAAQLKKQIAAIQQQSLQTLRESVQSVFKNSSSANLQQMARQQQQIITETRRPEPQEVPGPGEALPAKEISPDTGTEQIKTGRQALAIANKGAQQALESAKQGFTEVKKLMANLEKKRKKNP